MTLCTDLTLVKVETDQITITPLRCRCWSCDHCQPVRQAQLVEKGMAGHPNMFLTLTTRPRVLWAPERHARELVKAWRTVRRRAIKKYGYKALPFMAVFEATKKGLPHLHILARCKWLDQAWLSNQMRQLMNSPIVDVRRVDNPDRSVRYVAKYVGKEPHHFGTTKRYWTSQDWLIPSDDEEDPGPPWVDWKVVREPLGLVVGFYTRHGWNLHNWKHEEIHLSRASPASLYSVPAGNAVHPRTIA